ncbi:Methionine aminopeptidase [Liberibacter crescens BT-1]|uniref:Methionine aminopeptidase n=1 Tax=Liberibacter crescens (strain BT-1) TaxID=1215343 RepID=L0EUA1_LIBCB|nr:type I methionyl aminopeptidase [Liberibacter crescens]AGA64430.1 Methionine aminopeptidase [Liberibacter crescens BT-1]AMC12612.1 methionine aminopeptidase [Liberibacter crescens]
MSHYLLKKTNPIKLYTPEEFQGVRNACQVTARCLDSLVEIVKPGITTNEIDYFVFKFGIDNGAFPATLNYRGYKKSTCTSINHVVCHGIPNDKPLQNGDIVNIDVTYVLDGWYGDASRMYPIGKIKRSAERLLEVTYEALCRGIATVKPNAPIESIGQAIQTYAEKERCSVVKAFCGHGIGHVFHDKPEILHYSDPTLQSEGNFQEGMIFTIEPMINLGLPDVKMLSDGWTAVTRDRSLSAQYEHTIGVTKTGYEIFTLSPAGLERPGFPHSQKKYT